MFGLRENDQMPICKAHVLKIVDCHPCQKLLIGFEKSMPKVTARWWSGMPAPEWHFAQQKCDEENQSRLHSWAVANLYGDPNKLDEEPF